MPSPYYEKNQSIPHNAWAYDYKPSFKFLVTDTNVYYNMYFLIRHTEAYPYSNIWIRLYYKHSEDKEFREERREVLLAARSGQWLGRGMGEIYEQRMMLYGVDPNQQMIPMSFAKKGVYEVRMEQDMRINPLPEILQVGLRVEKTEQPVVQETKK